ncbi:hypothetical protein [Bradyrhizobium manausense]|uniref:hypothetical protein n=1 Tax=Bradyrhizobium manausense TaxID=989370 RepID=UPI000B17C421|nr:hypothetical protein [Bradyrhizobium manausense]
MVGRRLKFLWTRLGRIDDSLATASVAAHLAQQVRSQDQHQRGPKVDALHAPEVECIG